MKILAPMVRKAIHSVKPWSTKLKDSIDIAKYVKILLIQYKDESKCRYINGVVLKKSIAHNRMKREIQNPKILVLAKTLGVMKDDEQFADLESDLKQEGNYFEIMSKKIRDFEPNLIFVQEGASYKAVDEMLKLDITVVSNIKETIIKRIERLTQTCSLPNVNLLSNDFFAGKCQNFYMETLQNIGLKRTADDNIVNNLIYLDGC